MRANRHQDWSIALWAEMKDFLEQIRKQDVVFATLDHRAIADADWLDRVPSRALEEASLAFVSICAPSCGDLRFCYDFLETKSSVLFLVQVVLVHGIIVPLSYSRELERWSVTIVMNDSKIHAIMIITIKRRLWYSLYSFQGNVLYTRSQSLGKAVWKRKDTCPWARCLSILR